MPNDAKLGLVVGVGLVIIVAVVFFRKDLATSSGLLPEKAAVSTYRPTTPQRPAIAPSRPTLAKGRAMSRTESGTDARLAVRRHTVAEGDTLFTLARRYYGDGEKFFDLYKANRGVLASPDALPPGTELVIPDLGETKNESQAGLGEAKD
jgi:nucleoid-associated protein YgaU